VRLQARLDHLSPEASMSAGKNLLFVAICMMAAIGLMALAYALTGSR